MTQRYGREDANGVLLEVWDYEPDLAEGLQAVAISDDAQPNWRRSGGAFVPPELPELAPAPSPPLVTSKADLWRRATDEEAVQMDEALKGLPVRLRKMYEDSQYIDHADEFFPALSEGLIGLFGEARASILLGVSV